MTSKIQESLIRQETSCCRCLGATAGKLSKRKPTMGTQSERVDMTAMTIQSLPSRRSTINAWGSRSEWVRQAQVLPILTTRWCAWNHGKLTRRKRPTRVAYLPLFR